MQNVEGANFLLCSCMETLRDLVRLFAEIEEDVLQNRCVLRLLAFQAYTMRLG